jgi:hypothetical protein
MAPFSRNSLALTVRPADTVFEQIKRAGRPSMTTSEESTTLRAEITRIAEAVQGNWEKVSELNNEEDNNGE